MPYVTGFEGSTFRSMDGKSRCSFPRRNMPWNGEPFPREEPLTPFIVKTDAHRRMLCLFPSGILNKEPLNYPKNFQRYPEISIEPTQRRIIFERRGLGKVLPAKGKVCYIGKGPYCVITPPRFAEDEFEIPSEILRGLLHPAIMEKITSTSCSVERALAIDDVILRPGDEIPVSLTVNGLAVQGTLRVNSIRR